MAAPGAPGPGPATDAAAAAATVLMAARAELAAPCPLLPAAGVALRLQLSVQPAADGRRRFRLGLRLPEAGGGAPLAEFDLRDVSYRVCGPTSHELQLPGSAAQGSAAQGSSAQGSAAQGSAAQGSAGSSGPPGPAVSPGSPGTVSLRFPEQREAQQWWTVLSSSLREARRAPEGDTGTAGTAGTAAGTAGTAGTAGLSPEEPEQDAEEAQVLELAETEELSLQLARAISRGDAVLAAQSAAALARRQAELSVRPRHCDAPGPYISMPVQVEDAAASATITLRVRPQLTIGTLKEQVFREYGFHPLAQRWIIGQSLCRDGRTLGSYGIRGSGDPAHLYLLSARGAGLGPQHYRGLQVHSLLRATGLQGHGAPGTGDAAEPPEEMDLGDLEDLEDLEHLGEHLGDLGDLGEDLGEHLGDLGEHLGEHLDSLQLWDSAGAPPTAPEPRPPSPEQGWSCPRCTFLNKPTRPGCEMCSSPRPLGYRVPGGHRPDPTELQRLQQERHGALQCQQALEEERQRNFQQLLRAERAGLVPNPEPLECRICLQAVPPGGAVLLRDCLHSFCRECLRQVIVHSEEPQVPCPFRDVTYTCSSYLQEREIRALLSPEEHARFLARGLALAERRSRDSFHCRGPDCPGWCFTEGAAGGAFRCPVCGALNCLPCKAIHEGQSCRQFQEQLQLRAQDDAAAQQTQDMLQTLVQRGEAMHCPSCRIMVQKKDGCDWIRCSVCHTEICWVTKGPRWGPGGPGDTSGGCRCNVNGQRCHPQCQNCH